MEKSIFPEEEKRILQTIAELSGSYTPYVIFSDWVKMMAITIQNTCDQYHGELWKKREKAYLEVAAKYTDQEIKKLSYMMGLLNVAFEQNGINDYLGDIYMRSGAGSKSTGQFFTPFHLSVLTAQVGLKSADGSKINMREPSIGGGGMVLAAAKVLLEKGINYQRCLDVVGQDLDWNGVYMAYVQLSVIGIRATLYQGDSLQEGVIFPENTLYTPARMGALM